MQAGKKWIEGTAPEQPLSEAARIVLRDRLAAVAERVDAAGEKLGGWGEDGEPVHQLRVSTRRAAAVLKAARDLLPRRRAGRLRKLLRRARGAANDARNLDVLSARYRDRPAAGRGIAELIEEIEARRARAQKALVKLARRFRRKQFAERAEGLLSKVRWRVPDAPEPTFAAAARSELSRLAEKFLAAAREAASPEGLHTLRIRGKGLRYAIEIFSAAVPQLRETIYPALVEMQNLLGAANDHATAVALLTDWSRSSRQPARYEALLGDESRAMDEARRNCEAWLTSPAFANLKGRIESLR